MATPTNITDLLSIFPPDGRAFRSYRHKSDGGRRAIAMPNEELNKWLKVANRVLRRQFNSWPAYMHGGIRKRSYVSHARPHVGQPCVIALDIREYFDSITETDVAQALERYLKLPHDVANELANKLCFRGRLAQGYATSNYISNLCLLAPLSELHKELKRFGVTLTNYVDDIALSGAISDNSAVINLVARQLSRAGFALNKSKVVVMPANRRQVVCELVVNKRLSISRELKRRLFSEVASGAMSEVSAKGWVANLQGIDEDFTKRFSAFAQVKGVLMPTKAVR